MMADNDQRDDDEVTSAATDEATEQAETAAEEAPQKLQLEVKIDSRSACERHIGVTISREDIDRYFDKEYSELMPTAQVPGFRPGHAPRKLIEMRFRKDVASRVKSALLMDGLALIHEDEKLSAISEPDIDLDAIEIPKEGPLFFEFDLEVRPEFDLPQWKGLKIQKPVCEVSDVDVDWALENLLSNRGSLTPYDGAAQPGDYVTANVSFKHGDEVVSTLVESLIRLRPVLSFRDGKIENFDQLMTGVRAGETRQVEMPVIDEAPNAALRGQKLTVIFAVLEVKKLELPELTPELLDELGGFELVADLRDAIKDTLERRLEHEQRQRAREQIAAALTVAADWELPPELLQRQSRRELQRAEMELKRSGFSDDEIRAHDNELRQNSRVATAQALKEHFILERIAEDQGIDIDEDDYEDEIRLIARQSNESPRRVRAKLEKSNSMDVLRNQIIERKVVDLILEHAVFQEAPYQFRPTDAEAIDHSAAGGEQTDIPQAKPGSGEAVQGGRPEVPRARG
jgi:trigger factor